MTNQNDDLGKGRSRREFLATVAGVSAVAIAARSLAQEGEKSGATTSSASAATPGHVAGSDVIRVGVIGAGGRGTGAAINCVESSQGIEIVAIGDLFQDRVDECIKKLKEKIGDAYKATPETCFAGFDAFEKVLKTDCNMVILATPPGFRPGHLRAAVEAGKHIFTEKPVAVDPVGIRSVIETAGMAESKGLAVVAGTQRRHDPIYIETIKRIHDGAIGELTGGQCYWCQEGLWLHERKPDWTEMELQCRNWLYYDWLSGDHIVEQHVHNIDVMNWLFGGPPINAFAQGGRQARTSPDYGNVFDHFSVEFEYANGVRVQSLCRQTPGATGRVAERIVGTKGTANPFGEIKGSSEWKYEKPEKSINPYVQEHTDLIKSIRDGKPLNELKRVAESTLTAIMGRMSAYTGRQITWKWVMNSSKLDLTPARLEFGPSPINPVPVPGHTKLV